MDVLKIVTPDWQKARGLLQRSPGVQEVQSYGEALHVLVDSAAKRKTGIKRLLKKNNVPIQEIREITPRMEEAFISLIKRLESAG